MLHHIKDTHKEEVLKVKYTKLKCSFLHSRGKSDSDLRLRCLLTDLILWRLNEKNPAVNRKK